MYRRILSPVKFARAQKSGSGLLNEVTQTIWYGYSNSSLVAQPVVETQTGSLKAAARIEIGGVDWFGLYKLCSRLLI